MTNEERFIVSCEAVGEADVRAKLSASRYSELKSSWASSWLQRIDNDKSDTTKAEERSSRLQDLSRTKNRSVTAKLALLIAVMVAALAGFFLLR
jgi:hypothetical protein